MWRTLPLVLVVSCSSEDKPPVPTQAPAAPAPTVAAPPPPPAAPELDLSGKWECIWNVNGGQGSELWMVMHDGESITVTLRGRDPGGSYNGSITGTVKGRSLDLSFKYNDGTRGTMKLETSKNGQLLDGDSTRAKGGTVSHYGCSRST